jgi:hypothetical protein
MNSQTSALRDASSRPVGVKVLAACLALYGVQSSGSAVRLFPLWLDAARHHRYGNASFAWLEIVSAIAAFAAAYGLWRHRRWARIPTLVVVILALATVCVIMAFGIGGVASIGVWLVSGILLLLAFLLAAWLLRFVWRHT